MLKIPLEQVHMERDIYNRHTVNSSMPQYHNITDHQ